MEGLLVRRGRGLATGGCLMLVACLLCVLGGEVRAATLPAGFSEATVNGPAGANWNEAVGIHFEDNGRMYVWERGGRVWFKEYGANTWTSLIDISAEVGGWRDFGMLGFALDPNFRVNGYIYLMYVVDRHHLMNFGTPAYNPSTDQYYAATIGRITRYTARAADGFKSVDYASRNVLLGESRSNGIPILHESHGVGSLVFGTDGTLLASCGDGASYASKDIGNAPETYYSQALTDGIIKPKENVGAYRSQLVDSLNGKVLRLDPATGNGIPGNPFYDPANPRAAKSRVWALGVRNPCRMTLRPGTGSHNRADANPGVFHIGDVGYQTWEDLHICTGPGQNFGWPAFEGVDAHSGYYGSNVQNLDAPNPLYPGGGCSQYFYFNNLIKQNTTNAASKPPFNNPCNAAQKIPATIPQFLHTPPALDWKHGTTQARTWIYNGSGVAAAINVGAAGSPVSGSMFPGNCSVGGVWYTGNDFPAQYQNTYFHADYGEGWIKNFGFGTNNKPASVAGFLTGGGGIVALATHPIDGGLYYISWATTLRKITYSTGGNLPPTAVASANKYYGPGPLTVQFTGSASTDPEGLTLAFKWNFGDGTPTNTTVNPSHTFNAPGGVPTPYTVTLTVTDNIGQTSTAALVISVNNTPPTVNITSPTNGTSYPLTGDTIYNLTANVSDTESTDAQLKYEWQTFLHHNNHEHQDPINTNHVTTTVISPVGCDGETYYYRIVLKVTDPAGLSTQAEADLFPDCASLPLAITNTTLPNGFVGLVYSATLAGNGGSPPYTWSLTNGNLPAGLTLNTNSGTIAGTPTTLGTFNFTAHVKDASSPVKTATQALSITVTLPPRVIGNTNEGTLTDSIGASWINAGRFQAGANLTVTGMVAKVVAITGKYKCAIYSDNGGQPNQLLRSSAEVSNPATGWKSFPLTSSLALTSGQFYWLAIWSDNANAQVYYSDTEGTIRWANYPYGPWPDPIATPAGGGASYCIYATAAPALTATDMSVGMHEDTTTNLTLLGGGGAVTFAILTNPTNGVLGALNPNSGAVSYTPNLNFNGADTFRFTASNGSLQATGTVSLTVTAVNDTPTLTLASNNVVVLEDSGAVTVSSFATTTVGPANESAQGLTNIAVLNVSNATLFTAGPAISTGGTLTFTPAANSNGVAAVTVQARDNGGTANGGTNGSGAQTFTIAVTAVNDAPVAFDQSVTNAEDTAFAIALTGSDVDGPVVNFSVVGNPAHGQLSGVAPNLTYRPFTNYFGADSFTFRANDGSLTSAVATVSLTVTAVNDAPVATNLVVVTTEDTGTNVMLLGGDVDGSVTFGILSGPTNGLLSNLDTNSGAMTYSPDANYFGPDAFTITVSDGSLQATGLVSLTVTVVNDAPVAFDQSVTNAEDTAIAITLTGNDVDGPVVNFSVVGNPAHGELSGVAPNLTYQPFTNYFGADSFTFRLNDGSLTSAVATVSLTVTAVNDAPVASNLVVETLEDTATNVVLLGSDVDGSVTFEILNGPTNGMLSNLDTNSGAVTYTPDANYLGPDAFTFTVGDGSLQATGLVSLTMTVVNDAPVATNLVAVTVEDTATNLILLGSDVEGAVTFGILTGPTNGILSNLDTNSGAVTYTPITNYFGPDAFTFTVNDGSLQATGLVSLTVMAVNDAPVANDDNYNLGGGATLDIPAPGVLTNDNDVEGDSLTAILVSNPIQGTLILNNDGGFNYTPTNHLNGVDTFTYQASDGQATSAPVTVNIVVSNTIQISFTALSNGIATLTWTAIAGKNYRLQYKDNLSDVSWTELPSDVSATGPTATGTNAIDTSIQRFYRVLYLGQ